MKIEHELTVDEDARNAYLIITDPAAGRPNVFTVHRIALAGHRGTTIVGREIPIDLARQIVRSRR